MGILRFLCTQQWIEQLQRRKFEEIDVSISLADFVIAIRAPCGALSYDSTDGIRCHEGYFVSNSRGGDSVAEAT